MLVLSRKVGERIVIPAIETTINLLDLSPARARIGIEAPTEIVVMRSELDLEASVPSLLSEINELRQKIRVLEQQVRVA